MFLGQHFCLVNRNQSLTFPAHFRELVREGAYLTQGFDRNLLLLPPGAFKTMYGHITALNLADPTARLLLRLILGSACLLDIGASGKFTIPKRLLDFANIKDRVVILGQGDFCEIWSQELWLEQETRLMDAHENSRRFSTLVITT